MTYSPEEFEALHINDLEKNKFTLDSNGDVAVRVL
jgi:hypothetical protein